MGVHHIRVPHYSTLTKDVLVDHLRKTGGKTGCCTLHFINWCGAWGFGYAFANQKDVCTDCTESELELWNDFLSDIFAEGDDSDELQIIIHKIFTRKWIIEEKPGRSSD